MSDTLPPRPGEVWDAPLDPVRGHEQGGFRPVVVISADWYNQIPHNLCIIIPLSRSHKGVDAHITIPQGETGLHSTSYALCEQVRAISVSRLRRKRGIVSTETLSQMREIVHHFLTD